MSTESSALAQMIDPVVAALAAIDAPWAAVAAVTEHFVITNGRNSRQVKAIVNEVEHQVKLVDGPGPIRVEGQQGMEWVLMDYGGFVVHVFSEEARSFYQLERLWKDCKQLDWRSLAES
jgi:ribosome-associated protein